MTELTDALTNTVHFRREGTLFVAFYYILVPMLGICLGYLCHDKAPGHFKCKFKVWNAVIYHSNTCTYSTYSITHCYLAQV